MTIRPAQVADAEAIARLLHELAAGEGRHSLQTAQTVTLDMLAENALMRLLVAEAEGGAVVGVLCYYQGYDVESASFGYHLADIIVTKASRGQGIGKKLMQEVARITLEQGGEWLSWTLLRDNRAAHAFYRSLGAKNIPVSFMAMGRDGLKTLVDSAR